MKSSAAEGAAVEQETSLPAPRQFGAELHPVEPVDAHALRHLAHLESGHMRKVDPAERAP
uniref:hypothetical protein n=1 Tax=Acidocella sp. C78 TaxID=1671486 RepID=UPI0020C02BC0|nr:hypothetical protein [Acidocella sp. C78]